jgi:hypothetical protein
MSARGGFDRHVAAAVARHRGIAPYVRLVADALPPRERRPWQRMADVLAAGDASGGIEGTRSVAGCWIPLIASGANDPRLEARILQAAARAPYGAGGRWSVFVSALMAAGLALVLLLLLATTVLPLFEAIFEDFGIQLPWLTRMTLALGPALRSGWQPLLAAGGLGGLCWWSLSRRAARHAAVVADFTRTLARLVAGGVPDDDALLLASRVVAAPVVDAARPVRPLTSAAVAALEASPSAAAVLLDAVAECHEDRARGAPSVGEWFLGPLAMVMVGLFTGLLVVSLFLPLVKLVSDIS